MLFQLITVPIVGALIGWITNVLAIKMIFRPHKPITVPFFKYKIHGLIPKKRKEIAFNIGQVVGSELIPMEDVIDRLTKNGVREKIINSVVNTISQRVNERIPSIVPITIRKTLVNIIQEISQKEVSHLINKLFKDWERIGEEINFAQMIEEKINGFDLLNLERIILMIASRELRHIEILGAVLGFVIGLVQAMFFWFSNR